MTTDTPPAAVDNPATLVVPSRNLDTAWGALRVSCVHPHWVSFTTYRHRAAESTALLIHRVRYRFNVSLERAEVPIERRHDVIYFGDDTWYLEHRHRPWWLHRADTHDKPTEAAQDLVRHQLLPALVEWLNSDAAPRLLAEGESYWRADFQRHAAVAETQLLAAVDRIRELRNRVRDGQLVTPADDRYVRTVHVDNH